MSNFEPNKEHLRHVMIFLFNQKKKASESHRILVETYGDLAPTVKTCERWFQRFKSGVKNHGQRQDNHQHRVQDRIALGERQCCVWDQKGLVYYELLKPGETVNTVRYREQMINLNHALIEKRPEWARRHGKVILQHDNAPAHSAKVVKETISALGWELLPHPPYSPDLAPSDYHLFSSMGHALAEQHFKTFEDVRKWLDEWISMKDEAFFWNGIHKLPERWIKCVESEGQYFE